MVIFVSIFLSFFRKEIVRKFANMKSFFPKGFENMQSFFRHYFRRCRHVGGRRRRRAAGDRRAPILLTQKYPRVNTKTQPKKTILKKNHRKKYDAFENGENCTCADRPLRKSDGCRWRGKKCEIIQRTRESCPLLWGHRSVDRQWDFSHACSKRPTIQFVWERPVHGFEGLRAHRTLGCVQAHHFWLRFLMDGTLFPGAVGLFLISTPISAIGTFQGPQAWRICSVDVLAFLISRLGNGLLTGSSICPGCFMALINLTRSCPAGIRAKSPMNSENKRKKSRHLHRTRASPPTARGPLVRIVAKATSTSNFSPNSSPELKRAIYIYIYVEHVSRSWFFFLRHEQVGRFTRP